MKSLVLPVMRKEVYHILRDPRTLALSLIIPLFQLFLYGYALTFDIRNIPVAVYDEDGGPASRRLIGDFTGSRYFDVIARPRTRDYGRRLDGGEIRVAIVIPPGFGRDIDGGGRPALQVLVDGSDPIIARAGVGYAAAIASRYSASVTTQSLFRKGLVIEEGIPPIEARTRVWYNPELRSVNFIVPGLIAIIMMVIATVETALAIVREKERGTMENLTVSPIHGWELVIGKIVPYLGLAFINAALIAGIAVEWFGVPLRGSVLLLLLALTTFIIGNLGLGLLISTITESQQVASLGAFLVTVMPAFLLSGFVFPIRSMPFTLQLVTYAVPARYFIAVVRGIFLKGAGAGILLPQLLALTFFALLTSVLSSVALRRSLR